MLQNADARVEKQTPSRHLPWPECYNARDLGGLPTVTDTETRWRSVIRSDILNRLTADGQQALLAYGVRTVIDLRSPQEVEKEPSLFSQNHSHHPFYLNLPLEKQYPHVSALISQAKTRSEVYCIVLDHYSEAVADVMRAVVTASPGAVVIHCHAGKDRTGIIAALLLSLVEVPAEIIAADYAESQTRLWPLYKQPLTEAEKKGEVNFWLEQTATEEMIYRLLNHVDAKYGGADKYLRESGISSEEIDRLKARLSGS
jgi:protein-tyrosine phosphatase